MTSIPVEVSPPHPERALSSRAAWVIGLVLVLGGLLTFDLHGVDLHVYRAGAKRFLETPALLYAPGLTQENGYQLPFTYPPFAAWLMGPLALMSQPVAMTFMTVLSLGLLYLVMRDFAPRFATVLPSRWASLCHPMLFTGLMCWLAPFRDSIMFGQINIILFALVYLACVHLGLGFWAGVVVGLFGGIKLTPLALGLVPFAWGKWRMLLGMAAGFFGTILLMAWMTPGLTKEYWLVVLRDPSRVGGIGYFDNISFEGVIARFGFDMKGIWFLAVLVLSALGLMALSGLRGHLDIPAQLGIGAAVMLAISPISWSHHATWLPLMVYALLSVAQYTGRLVRTQTALAVAMTLLFGTGFRIFAWDSAEMAPVIAALHWRIVASLPLVCLVSLIVLVFTATVSMPNRHGIFELPPGFRRRSPSLPPRQPSDPPTKDEDPRV